MAESIYIGSIDTWLSLMMELSQVERHRSLLDFFDEDELSELKTDILKIIDNFNANRGRYESLISKYPFKLTKAFSDLWLSGMVDFIEVFIRLKYRHKNGFQPKDSSHYGEVFYLPCKVFDYKKSCGIYEKLTNARSYMEEIFEDESSQEYYLYPNDEYGLVAPSLDSLERMYLIAEGEVEVNGSLIFINTDSYVRNKEYEVALWSISESTVKRYPNIAEMVMQEIVYTYFFKNNRNDFSKELLKIIKY